MANVKNRYAEITKQSKTTLSQAAETAKSRPGGREEERLFAKFRERAREDFRTLNRTVSSSS